MIYIVFPITDAEKALSLGEGWGEGV